jgi:hypothetical protein
MTQLPSDRTKTPPIVRSFVLGLIAVLALASADSALGAKGVVRDARGDARAPWDITKITVHNSKSNLRIRIDYRGRLHVGRGEALLVNVRLDTGFPAESTYEGDFTIDMLRGSSDPSAPDRLHLYAETLSGSPYRMNCKGLSLRMRKRTGIVEFAVPQSCFSAGAQRLRIAGHSYLPRAAPDQADYIETWSRWIKPG